MNKTKIEWCDYSLNPVKGLCPMACPYCYARRMYKNPYYKALYQNQQIRFDWSVANDLAKMESGSKVFWGSTMELFGKWVDPEWLRLIFEAVKRHPDLTHIFLTKLPQNLIKWSPFPDNCWVGVSATNNDMAWSGVTWLEHIEASLKFISLEPLLAPLHSEDGKLDFTRSIVERVDWLIIGQQTPVRKATKPKIEWVKEIVEVADKAQTKVFLKDNLNSCAIADYPELLDRQGNLRQEFPIVPLS